MKTSKKTFGITFAILALTLILLSFASASMITNTNAEYKTTSKYYPIYISNAKVGFFKISIKGIDNGLYAESTFFYTDGTSYTTPQKAVNGDTWNIFTFENANYDKYVKGVSINLSQQTSFKDLYVYNDDPNAGNNGNNGNNGGTGNNGSEGNGNNNGSGNGQGFCGNGIKEAGEECDNGENNGIKCTPEYGSSCNYCSSECKTIKLNGGFCGDGILQASHEQCDDGNRINNDKCNNNCRKPFSVTVEDFAPLVWQCHDRVVYDDSTEPGRVSAANQVLVERINNYAFEGEQIKWTVLVMDKNGIDKVKDVYVSLDGSIEANCKRIINYKVPQNNNPLQTPGGIQLFNFGGGSIGIGGGDNGESGNNNGNENNENKTNTEVPEQTDPNAIDPSCNARILEEKLTTFNPETMAYYECTLTVETFDSMYGEYEVTVEAEDLDGIIGEMAEMEYWFFNPLIQLSIDGEINFDEVRPGTSSYSRRVLIGNDADFGSGVLLDMFISGTNFYDSSSSGAKCPTTNQLSLSNFAYYATNGAYSTKQDMQIGRTKDAEGYLSINYGIGFNNPNRFYDRHEIIQANNYNGYYLANILAPGSKMSLIFKLNMPEPCNGNFDSGSIYFWGEAL